MSEPSGTTRRRPPTERRTEAIDAFIDLVLERNVPPRPELVAERAGVSIATLYRYFSTLDELRREATARVLERYAGLFAVPDIGTGSRHERIGRFAASRVDLHETLHPLELLARATAAADPGAAETIDLGRRVQADQIRLHFDDELRELTPTRRENTVAAIAVLTSVESWQQFRRNHERTANQTRRALVDALDCILPTS